MSRSHPRPWHGGSTFGEGARRALDRNQRARFAYLLDAHYRARRLPSTQERVGRALLRRLGADGRCDPCYATLGADAGCSARTARRATATMRALGLLTWRTRLIRNGWRAEQTSNAYELLTTAENPLPRCGGQGGPETRRQDTFLVGIEVERASPEEHRAAAAALKAARERPGLLAALMGRREAAR